MPLDLVFEVIGRTCGDDAFVRHGLGVRKPQLEGPEGAVISKLQHGFEPASYLPSYVPCVAAPTHTAHVDATFASLDRIGHEAIDPKVDMPVRLEPLKQCGHGGVFEEAANPRERGVIGMVIRSLTGRNQLREERRDGLLAVGDAFSHGPQPPEHLGDRRPHVVEVARGSRISVSSKSPS